MINTSQLDTEIDKILFFAWFSEFLLELKINLCIYIGI